MNLQQLYYFKTIAELEHYTQAARKLNISPSSLSHSITDLEKELGVSLFIRQGRNVRLTSCGAFFLDYVSRSLEILDEGRSRLQDFISPESGMMPSASLRTSFVCCVLCKLLSTPMSALPFAISLTI